MVGVVHGVEPVGQGADEEGSGMERGVQFPLSCCSRNAIK